MYYYFSCQNPFAMKVDGQYLGIIKEDKILNSEKENTFIEIYPINSKTFYSFTLNDVLLTSNDILITDLNGGYFLSFPVKLGEQSFKILNREQKGKVSGTIYFDLTLKLSIDTQNDFLVDNLDIIPTDSKIVISENEELPIIIFEFMVNGKKCIIVYSIYDKIKQVFYDYVDDYILEDKLIIKSKILDIAKHNIESEYSFNNGQLIRENYTCTISKNFSKDSLSNKIFPYAFLEEVLYGDNIEQYLDKDLITSKDKIKSYFGNFIGIMPPPFFIDSDKIGLIYKKSQNRYFVKYCKVSTFDKKVTNIKID